MENIFFGQLSMNYEGIYVDLRKEKIRIEITYVSLLC
jgi:hypothetical protein